MRSKLFSVALMIVVLAWMIPSGLLAAENPVVGGQGGSSDDQKYVGLWAGTFSSDDGGTNKLSYAFSKDEKGQWRGTMKWVNPQGEQTADFKSLQIADGKMKGKIESPDGQAEITIEGLFQGDKFEGTYAVSSKGSADVAEKGTWKVAKSAAAPAGK